VSTITGDKSQQPLSSKRTLSVNNLVLWGVVGCILLVSAGLRLYDLGGATYWTDEVFTERRAIWPIDEALETMYIAGNQGPFYYLTLRPLPNETEFQLRLPSAVMGVVGVLALMGVAWHLYRDRSLALWAGALLAVSPFHVMLSRHARAYGLLFVVCLLASYTFLLLVHRSNDDDQTQTPTSKPLWLWAAFTLSSLAAYLTHYSAGALGVAQLVYIALYRRRDRAFQWRWVVAQTIASLPFVVWMILLALNFESTYESGFTPPTLFNVPISFWNMVIGYDGGFVWWLLPGLVAVAVGLLWGWFSAARHWQHDRANAYWLLLTAVSVVPVVIIALTITPAYQDRYFTVFVPAIYLLLVLGWSRLPAGRYAPMLKHAGLTVILLTGAANTVLLFDEGDYQRADWASVNTTITANAQPGDGLLFERDHPEMVFDRYFTGSDAYPRLLLQETPETAAFEAETDRIWVVYRNPLESFHRQGAMPAFDAFDPDLNIVGAWLAEREGRVLEVWAYQGVTLALVGD